MCLACGGGVPGGMPPPCCPPGTPPTWALMNACSSGGSQWIRAVSTELFTALLWGKAREWQMSRLLRASTPIPFLILFPTNFLCLVYSPALRFKKVTVCSAFLTPEWILPGWIQALFCWFTNPTEQGSTPGVFLSAADSWSPACGPAAKASSLCRCPLSPWEPGQQPRPWRCECHVSVFPFKSKWKVKQRDHDPYQEEHKSSNVADWRRRESERICKPFKSIGDLIKKGLFASCWKSLYTTQSFFSTVCKWQWKVSIFLSVFLRQNVKGRYGKSLAPKHWSHSSLFAAYTDYA